MRVREFDIKGYNTGLLQESKLCNSPDKDCGYVSIIRGNFKRCGKTFPLIGENTKYYYRHYSLHFKKKIIYGFYKFGNKDKNTLIFVEFNWWQHQRFLLLQRAHWFQQETNIRYIVNIVFLIIGAYLGFKSLK